MFNEKLNSEWIREVNETWTMEIRYGTEFMA